MDDKTRKLMLERLQATKQKYAVALPDKIRNIRTSWLEIMQNSQNMEEFDVFHRQLHTLAGSAGTFGFPDVGQAARTVEVVLKEVLLGEVPPDVEQKKQIQTVMPLTILGGTPSIIPRFLMVTSQTKL
jgi:chemotaxis protein histidine kinase CheA